MLTRAIAAAPVAFEAAKGRPPSAERVISFTIAPAFVMEFAVRSVNVPGALAFVGWPKAWVTWKHRTEKAAIQGRELY
jgi:hypothetical protein